MAKRDRLISIAGCSSPENVQQLSFSIKGKPYTYYRMASVNR